MAPDIPPRRLSQASSVSSLSEYEVGRNRIRSDTIHLTPHTIYPNSPYSNSTGLNDPRSSSTQSLRPVESAGPNRRTLLLVYIHGFMGTETSFKSFPAHVHSLLTSTLAESHVVYTKIYPRYQSRKNISFARDAFGNWLAPLESDTTDVILLGHSLGGILAAEVALLPSHTPGSNNFFQHRILGQIAYDTPFLGMHPGVVSTGIASLFRGSPDQPEQASQASAGSDSASETSAYGLFEPKPNDPNYNPALPNDVHLPVRKNKLDRAWYFFNKHYGDVTKAASSYVKSHLEFGGCLADYQGLRKRYDNVRRLEDIHGVEGIRTAKNRIIPRVRFVNYYTASTGRIKEKQLPPQNQTLVAETEMSRLARESSQDQSRSRPGTPRISLEEHTHHDVISKDLSELNIDNEQSQEEMRHIEPRPSTPSSDGHNTPEHGATSTLASSDVAGLSRDLTQDTEITSSSVDLSDLPPIPPVPTEPAPFNPILYKDSEVLALAQKDHDRRRRAFETAMRDRDEAVRDRQKIIAKRETLATKEQEKLQKESIKRQSTLNQESYDKQLAAQNIAAETRSSTSKKPAKKQKDRKFCTLPKKDPNTGKRDPTWIRVYMEGMDEVVAHTSLFFVSEAYAKLVGDTAERIEGWVHEDATRRAILATQYG